MSLYRSSLCALVLLVAMPGRAEAGGRLIFGVRQDSGTARVDVLSDGKTGARVKYGQCWVFAGLTSSLGSGGVGNAATATLKSDAGKEDVTLVESDAWLHGAGKIGTLPKTEAALTLTLYDKGSATLMSFSGTLGTEGEVSLTADETKEAALDIEVLGGEVFGASGSLELGLDLAGADTFEVAYATITVTESTEVTTCDKSKTCTTTGSSTTTKAEVDWDDIGAVWEGDLTLAHEGAIDAKVRTYDAKGEELETTKVALAVPWLDDGEGINVQGIDEDPLTRFGVVGSRVDVLPNGEVRYVANSFAVTSSGWTTSTAPAAAELTMTNGGTITMSSAILFRMRKRPELLYQAWDAAINEYISDIVENPIYTEPATGINPLFGAGKLSITGGSVTFVNDSLSTLSDSPICVSGGCFMLVDDGNGSYDLSISVYSSDAIKLPDDLELTVTLTDDAGEKVFSVTDTVGFEDDVTAVFANEVSFTRDPVGLDLSGELSLLAAADGKGKQKTLTKGKFYGSYSRDADGDLSLAGADKDDVSSEGSIVVAAEAYKADDVNGPPLTVVTPLFGSEAARVVHVRRGKRRSEAARKDTR